MPKMKSHSGAKKRVKVTGTGKFIVKGSGSSHILTKKKRKKKNKMKKDMVVKSGTARKIPKLLAGGKGR